jgi:hypothetical protein
MTIPQHSVCLQPYNPKIKSYPKRWQLDHRRLSETILKSVWSPTVFSKPHRCEKNFVHADWLGLDFESEMRLEDAKNTFSDMFHIIGTTRNHTEESHRFRVCLLFEKRITDLQTFRFNVKHYIDHYESDGQCRDGARLFYPCKSIYSKLNEPGLYKVEVLAVPPNFEMEIPIEKGEFSRFVMATAGQTIPCGRRDVTTWAFARDLAKAGFTREETKGFIHKWLTYEKPFNFEAKVDTVFKQLRSESGKEKARIAKGGATSHGGSVDDGRAKTQEMEAQVPRR